MSGGIRTLSQVDVEDILKFIQHNCSPERIFGYIWIISWIGAIWVYHLQFFLTGVFCLFLSLVIFERKVKLEHHPIPSRLTMDKSSRTLVVQELYQQGLNWEDHEVCSGEAILPRGVVSPGDKIVNCRGNVAVRHIPTNTLMGAFDFEEPLSKNKL